MALSAIDAWPARRSSLGKITQVVLPTNSPPSLGITLNNKGQVALPVRIEGSTTELVLLTPAAP
jgi:hypothetical protein